MGAPGAYPVLYLGRPEDSVVIEAYRHLIDDDLDGMPASAVGPRRLLTCEVNVEKILDPRVSETQRAVGLDADALCSDVGAYGPCLRVSQPYAARRPRSVTTGRGRVRIDRLAVAEATVHFEHVRSHRRILSAG